MGKVLLSLSLSLSLSPCICSASHIGSLIAEGLSTLGPGQWLVMFMMG